MQNVQAEVTTVLTYFSVRTSKISKSQHLNVSSNFIRDFFLSYFPCLANKTIRTAVELTHKNRVTVEKKSL